MFSVSIKLYSKNKQIFDSKINYFNFDDFEVRKSRKEGETFI